MYATMQAIANQNERTLTRKEFYVSGLPLGVVNKVFNEVCHVDACVASILYETKEFMLQKKHEMWKAIVKAGNELRESN